MQIVDLRGKLPTHKTKKYSTRKESDIRSIAIHHSLTFSGSPEAFANYHVKTNGWPGIAYPYVIQRDGTIYKCHDHNVVTYHVGNSNKHALGICMVGDFRTQQPTKEQYSAALWLVRKLQQELPNAKEVKGHSQYPGYTWKACPVISMDKFRADLINGEGDEETMTHEEKQAFEALQKQVSLLNKALQQIEPPVWFVNEFGEDFIKKTFSNPKMTSEGWRSVAISLRTVR